MPRKRIKSKKIEKVNLNILDGLLYESICKKKSMEELFREDEHKRSGIDDGLNGWSFDKNDPKVCAHVWNLHGKAVMEEWKLRKWNAGARPYTWWKLRGMEKPNNQLEEAKYLEDNNLLEPWEIKELKKD